MTDPYARPTGRVARLVESARYATALVMIGGASVVGMAGIFVAVVGVLGATVISGRAARTMLR